MQAYMHAYMRICVHNYIYTKNVQTCMCVYVCMYVCMHACMYVYVCMYACMDGWMAGWMDGCMDVRLCTYLEKRSFWQMPYAD